MVQEINCKYVVTLLVKEWEVHTQVDQQKAGWGPAVHGQGTYQIVVPIIGEACATAVLITNRDFNH